MKKIVAILLILLVLIVGCAKKTQEVQKPEVAKIATEKQAQNSVQNISSNLEEVSKILTDLEADLDVI